MTSIYRQRRHSQASGPTERPDGPTERAGSPATGGDDGFGDGGADPDWIPPDRESRAITFVVVGLCAALVVCLAVGYVMFFGWRRVPPPTTAPAARSASPTETATEEGGTETASDNPAAPIPEGARRRRGMAFLRPSLQIAIEAVPDPEDPRRFTFTAALGAGETADIRTWTWEFADGATADGAAVTRGFAECGYTRVRLVGIDAEGRRHAASTRVLVPPPALDSPEFRSLEPGLSCEVFTCPEKTRSPLDNPETWRAHSETVVRRPVPDPAGLEDWYVLRYRGFLVIDPAGTYRLSLASDDGSRLELDGEALLAAKHANPDETVVELAAGVHRLGLDYTEEAGEVELELTLKRRVEGDDWEGVEPMFFHRPPRGDPAP